MKHVDTGIVEGGERTCPVGQHFNTRKIHCGCYDPDQTFLDKGITYFPYITDSIHRDIHDYIGYMLIVNKALIFWHIIYLIKIKLTSFTFQMRFETHTGHKKCIIDRILC